MKRLFKTLLLFNRYKKIGAKTHRFFDNSLLSIVPDIPLVIRNKPHNNQLCADLSRFISAYPVVSHFLRFAWQTTTTDEKQWLSNDLNCVYDGDIGCDRAWGFDEGKSFSTSVALSAGIGSDGYVCYIVPEKAKSVVLSYGDYVRVNIDLRDLSYRTESSQTSTDNT